MAPSRGGVLDRLLDDETIEIIGVTGTSAGAMNGAVLVDGLVRGGPKQARTKLRRYWEAQPYWDGSLTGNPAFGPLLTKKPDCDLIIVRVDPVNRPEAPRSVRDIFSRTVEISHNLTFWLELGAIAVVLRFVDEARSPFGRARFHIIEASQIMEKFPMSSKLNNYSPLLEYLFNLGRQTGDAWIAQNGDALGQRSTMDVQQLLPQSIWDNI
jgi:predicted acylesterase/phospholipase RssA